MKESFTGSGNRPEYSWASKPYLDKRIPALSPELVRTETKLMAKLKRGFNAINRKFAKHQRLIFSIELLVLGGLVYQNREQVNSDLLGHDATRGSYEKILRNKTESELISKLDAEVGKDTVLELEKLDSISSEQERQEALAEVGEAQVAGFDKFKLPNQVFVDAIKTLPLGFRSKKQTTNIRYEDKLGTVNDSYGLSKSVTASNPTVNTEVAHASVFPREIVFTKGAQIEDVNLLVSHSFTHEEIHENDYRTNKLLSLQERLQLLSDLVDRVHSPERFKSDYVEGINNADPKSELASKVVEYWAEIGSVYLSNNYFSLPQADRELVAGVISKVDPGFKREKSMKDRERLVELLNEKIKSSVVSGSSGTVKP